MRLFAPGLLAALLGLGCSSGSTTSFGTEGGAVGFTSNTGGIGSSISSSGTSGGMQNGSVVFSWQFTDQAGDLLSCAAAGVSAVQVVMGGNQIPFACAGASQTGTVVGVAPGDVPYTFNANAADGATVASVMGDVDISAGTQTSQLIVLTVQPQLGAVGLSWSFDGLTCVQAAVTQVSVELAATAGDGGPQWSFPCEPFGDGGAGALIEGLPPGEQTLLVLGLGPADGGPIAAWGADAGVTVTASGTTPMTATLAPLPSDAGSVASFAWTFQGLDCLDAGAPTLLLAVARPDGGDSGVQLPCSSGGLDGTSLIGLFAGPYGFTLAASLGDAGATQLSAGGTFFVNGLSQVSLVADLVPSSSATTGALSISYQLGDFGFCGDAGLDAIETKLFGPSGALVQPAGDVVTPCNSPPVAFDDLPAGLYSLNAQGLADGVQEYALFGQGITVSPGATSSYLLTLPPAIP